MPKHPETVKLEAFGGLDNKRPPERMEETFLEIATNIDIDHKGGIRKRKGYTNVIPGTACHSLWAASDDLGFFIDGSTLYDVDLNNYSVGILTTLSGPPYGEMAYKLVGSRVYMSNGQDSFIYDVRTSSIRQWGIEAPRLMPLLSAIGGQLTAGTYQVAIVYEATDGRRSGSGVAVKITVNDNSGINIFGIPQSQDPQVARIVIYVSTPNGEVLYEAGKIANGTTSYQIVDMYGKVVPLDNQFVSRCPGGSLVENYNGRMYIANGSTLWYSEPHAYEWYNLARNFIQFESGITNIMPVDDGIFITADKLYFLEGSDPSNFRLREREIYKAVPRTAIKIIGGDIIMENIPTGMKWLFTSDKGFIMVGTGGMVFNLTEKYVMIDTAESGAAMFRSHNGINQYVSVLRDPTNNRLHVGDNAVATVVRNGIVIT